MKKVFNKIRTKCYVCGTPLNGQNLLKRGDKYYCPSDFEKTSAEEKIANKAVDEKIEEYQRLFR